MSNLDFELIDKLPRDIKEEVFTKLMLFGPFNSKNLLLVNNQFADVYSYTRRLAKIKSKSIPIDRLSKQIDSVVAIIGDLKLQKLDKYLPIKDILEDIFNYNNINLTEEQEQYMFEYDTLIEAKEIYERRTNAKDFEKRKQEYIEQWNFINCNFEDRINMNKNGIECFREEIDNYEPESTKEDNSKIDAYLKITRDNTYAEYINAVKDLPVSVKVIIV